MHMLVFGKTGQVGTALKLTAIDHKHEVTALDRLQCDVTDHAGIVDQIRQHQPDIVVNATAYTAVDKAESDPETAYAVNSKGPENLASATFEFGLPLVHISTDYVFDGQGSKPYTESDQTNPVGVYGASKLEGELAVAAANPAHIILRTAWVFSPFGNNFLKTMLRLAGERDRLTVVSDQVGNPTDAFLIAKGIHRVCERLITDGRRNVYGTYHLCGPSEMSWAEFARAIFRQSEAAGGATCEVEDIPTSAYPTPAKRPANSRLDSRKFQEVFNWQPEPLDQAIAETVKQLP